MILALKALFGALSLLFGAHIATVSYLKTYDGFQWTRTLTGAPTPDDLACRPFLPRLFDGAPPQHTDARIQAAAASWKAHLDEVFAREQLDALSVALVSPSGTILEAHWGARRSNESDPSKAGRVDRHSIYRLASISKLFITFQGQQLAQQGIIQWDDPVSKHLPSYAPNFTSFTTLSPTLEPVVTLRDLASHTSGLGRDWPPGALAQFPNSTEGSAPPPDNGLPFPTLEGVLDAVQKYSLVNPPGVWPSYSNTGLGILGQALVAANHKWEQRQGLENPPSSVAELMLRDVFSPLGMNGSTYLATPENVHAVVVPSFESDVVDQDFRDAMNPSGGQFSSLSDLIQLSRVILDPAHHPLNPRKPGPLSESTIAHWLKPTHSFEEDDWAETGLVWEIVKHIDSYGRRRRSYEKLGNLENFHSAFTVHPGSSYAAIVLSAGNYSDAGGLTYAALNALQPAIDASLAEAVVRRYTGQWRAMHGHSEAVLEVRQGTLWLSKYVLGESNVLRVFGAADGEPFAMREVRPDEFRIDVGMPSSLGLKHMGCMSKWVNLDWGMKNGAGVNVVYFAHAEDGAWELRAPSVGVVMRRVSLK